MKIIHKKLKVHSLTGRITPKIMEKAWKNVRKNRGAAGIDKISTQMFESNLEDNLHALMKSIKTRGTFRASPLKRVYIPKGRGKRRPLGIPTVATRIAQEVIRILINPIFEKMFHPDSYGFRPGRNCHQAVEKVLEYLNQGFSYVVDADIKGFFDNISHDLIMNLLRAEIADGNILDLIQEFLGSGVIEDGQFVRTLKGTPQGGVISPLLANIVLNHLDWQLTSQGYRFVRYADDFVILCKTRHEAEKALDFARHILKYDLDLKLSPEKTMIVQRNEGFHFLGFFIKGNSIKMRKKSEEKFKDKIRDLTQRKKNLDREAVEKLNRCIRGTVNYFSASFTTTLTQFSKLDKWIRKRIRCMKYKRIWHTDNRRLKNKHIKRLGLLECRTLCLR